MPARPDRIAGRVSLGRILAYAAPAPALALLGLPLNVYLPAVWSESMGVPLATVGLVLAAVRLLDVVTDPAIGIATDRVGRRKPFVLAALPVGIIGGFLLFFPNVGAGAAWLFGAYALLTLGWSLLSLPWQAWGAEITPDYGERSRVTGWREAGTLAGVVISAVVPALLGTVQPQTVLHVLSILAAVLGTPAVLVLIAVVPEPSQIRTAARPHAWRGIVGNRPFRRLLLAWLVNGVANGLPAALFLLLCRHVLGDAAIAGPALLAYFLSGIVCVPLWTWLSHRIGKHRAWAAAMLWTCIAFLPVMLLGPGDGIAFVAICIASGAGLGADLSLPPAMQADVVDLDTLDHGAPRAGTFFAAWTMAQKAGNAFAAGIGLGLLGLAGFAASGANSRSQLVVLSALYCLLPVLLKLVAIAIVWRFPIDRAEQSRIRDGLETRAREAGAAW